ncbi:ABC transporter permease [Olsenella sp. Marseille-QA0557]|uniref:ABC transporter permease n=1 Tax=Candidatus Coprovicinus avistercoris TaxID=2840754 RepID=A0A9D1HW16_9ACTN|nr:ABC transporter permease [Candidatus Coprovicinus avistercoris]
MSPTARYILNRVLIGILVVFCVSVAIFAIMQAMPGDPVDLMTSERVSAERVAQIKQNWGLDQPPVIQYFYWLGNVLRGDFGTSITTGQEVTTLILERLPYTLMLTGAAIVLEYVVSIPLGLYAAVHKDGAFDRVMNVLMVVLWSMPAFWLGVLLILLFAINLGILPISGWSGPASLILPTLALALPNFAQIFRLTRSEVLDVLDARYVKTATAKGLLRNKVLIRHVLRNALIPVTVTFFLSLPWLIGGAVVVENVFAWPGMGRLLWTAISRQDFPIVQGIVFVISVLTVICNLIGDVVSGLLDPRVRLAQD